MIFISRLQKALKQDLVLPVMNYIDHFQKEKTKKVTGLMKDELG